ncbi:MAG: YARHG domain-containing protein [Ruminococcus sp.]|jgi:hypothetical protein
MYCEKCGAQLGPDDAYCPECGAKVEDDATVRMGYDREQSHREYVQEHPNQQRDASWQNRQSSRQQGTRYRPDERFYQEDYRNQNYGSGHDNGSKDKILYAFLGVITVVLVIGIIWGVRTLISLNNEEDVAVEAEEASAEETNPDLESETEEEVTVTPSPTEEAASTPIPTPAVTAVPTATPVPTQAPAAASSNGDYIIPDSATRELTTADLTGLSEWELRVARNEIYARHGRMFEDASLDSYFRGKSWYVPSIPADSFDDNQLLTKTELRNAKLISDYEAAMGYN